MSSPREFPRDIEVAPSILSADFARLGEQVAAVMDAGSRVIHVDVMDGHFVPPITFGAIAVEALRDQVHDAGGLLDVHLMIEWPERHVERFAQAGADGISLHVEATPHVDYALNAVRDAGCRAGLAINPATPPETAVAVADILDHALCMTVNPGWGGQSFIERSPTRIARLRELLGDDVIVEVDGGIDTATARLVVEAGATLLVAGSAVFTADDPGAEVRAIADAARGD